MEYSMNIANKDVLLVQVASNPVLFLQLKEKTPAERVEFLLDTIKALPSIEGMRDGKLDDQLVPYLDYLFTAIGALPEAAMERRKYRSAAAARLFLCFTDTTSALTSKVLFPKIPKTFARLTSEMASSWAGAETEDETHEHLRSIANLYLKTGSDAECKDWRQAIRTAVNRSSRELSPQRLANAVVTLSEITTWEFGESIFDSVAIARVRKLIASRPASAVRDARLQLALGETPSCEAEEAVLAYTTQVAKLDATAGSLLRYDPKVRAGRRTSFDVNQMMVTIAIIVSDVSDAPILHAIEDIAGSIRLRSQSWVNPHHGEVTVIVELRNHSGVYKALTVGGIPLEQSSAA